MKSQKAENVIAIRLTDAELQEVVRMHKKRGFGAQLATWVKQELMKVARPA